MIYENDNNIYNLDYTKTVIMCANNRLQVILNNNRTDEYIKIDENINDVRELYYTLRQFFLINDRDRI